MKKIFSFIVFYFSLLSFCFAQTSNISGIINSYISVSAVGLQSATVASATSFGVGNRVLLIQMKGATINTTNTNSYGTIINYNNAGNYEMATIASITGNTINFVLPVLRSYTPSDLIQLVKVPSYNNVVVTGQLTCTPWNGSTGGVLAFEANGTITFNADIDVSGAGFLGGALSNGAITGCAADTSDYVLPSTSLAAARKGEGIFNPTSVNIDGKGAWANGGGSGNDCNGGGAGGGNFGLGGHGGDPKVNVSCPPYFYQNSGGNSGKNLTYSNAVNKIFLGGGGGAGHQNDGAGTAGTKGGGIVLISGQSIVGNNHVINSNGIDNTIVAGIDGQGGGGAGGTVLLNVCSYTSLNVSVIGGLGGHDNFTGSDCHGKGGGGAGGVVWSSSPLTNVTTVLTGGAPGTFTSSACLCNGTSNGATQGGVGGALTGLVVPGSTTPIKIVDTTICSSSPVVLDAGTASSYTWSNG
ncbi:MAG TPA: hypothetical protein VN698_13220, partial [Bacteroidia bacterium]|nr:hypothetical protein [Bacteroidia bacterium]